MARTSLPILLATMEQDEEDILEAIAALAVAAALVWKHERGMYLRIAPKNNLLSTYLEAIGKPQWVDEITSEWLTDAKQTIRSIVFDGVSPAAARSRGENCIMRLTWKLRKRMLREGGCVVYKWRGMLDDREREKHFLWEKAIRLIDSEIYPFPGEEYGCRCWPEPIWYPTHAQLKAAK